MLDWQVHFRTARPFESLPRLLMASGETRYTPDYHHEGRFRASETHCLVKWTRSGRGIFRDRNGEYEIGRGMAFACEICDPGTAYYYPPDGEESWQFEYLCFTGGDSTQIVHELVDRQGPVFALAETSPIVRRLTQWRQLGRVDQSLRPSRSAAVVYEVLTSLAAGSDRSVAEDASAVLVERALELIERNMDRNLNATELAEMLGVSREHLSRVFGKEVSASPYRTIQRRKILQACRMLKETQLANKEIAAQLGYPSPAAFSRTFRSVMYMPPGQFRRVGVMPVSL